MQLAPLVASCITAIQCLPQVLQAEQMIAVTSLQPISRQLHFFCLQIFSTKFVCFSHHRPLPGIAIREYQTVSVIILTDNSCMHSH